MIRHNLYNKNEIVHCILCPANNSDAYIPIKAKIIDIQYHDTMPKYLIEILSFYDTFTWLRINLPKFRFIRSFDRKAAVELGTNRIEDPTDVTDFIIFLNGLGVNGYVVINSIHTWKTKRDMMEKYNKIQDYLISESIANITTSSLRKPYVGAYASLNKEELRNSMHNFLERAATYNNRTVEQYFYDLLR